MKKYLVVFQLCLLCFSCGAAEALETDIYHTKEMALEAARLLPEVKALYALTDGKYQHCIEDKVLKPCETDWVTCVEEAWVVRFYFQENCGFTHDGRLGVTVLIDALTGKIISRFPEKEYFYDENFCLAGFDCVYLLSEGELGDRCLNFIHGQLPQEGDPGGDDGCVCIENQCLPNN